MTARKVSLLANTCSLTPREAEATHWLAEGNQISEVAILMDISTKTVEIHVCNSMKKLGAPNRAQLTRAAIREGIVPCPRLERTEGYCRAVGEGLPMITTLDETKSGVGDAGTIQGLRAELKIVQAQLARFKDKESELRRLIAATNRRSER